MPLPATINDLAKALTAAQTRVKTAASEAQFLKLDKSGAWCYGADGTEVEDGSKWAVNPKSFATGYACWGDGELLGEEMALCTEDPVRKADLPHFEGRKWQEQIAFDAMCISGEDTGTLVRYSATSVGGTKAFKHLLDAVVRRAGEGHAEVVPIVHLEVDSYRHKKYGKIFTPELKIVDWAALDATVTTVESEDPIPEPEPEAEEKPTRRRKRRAA